MALEVSPNEAPPSLQAARSHELLIRKLSRPSALLPAGSGGPIRRLPAISPLVEVNTTARPHLLRQLHEATGSRCLRQGSGAPQACPRGSRAANNPQASPREPPAVTAYTTAQEQSHMPWRSLDKSGGLLFRPRYPHLASSLSQEESGKAPPSGALPSVTAAHSGVHLRSPPLSADHASPPPPEGLATHHLAHSELALTRIQRNGSTPLSGCF